MCEDVRDDMPIDWGKESGRTQSKGDRISTERDVLRGLSLSSPLLLRSHPSYPLSLSGKCIPYSCLFFPLLFAGISLAASLMSRQTVREEDKDKRRRFFSLLVPNSTGIAMKNVSHFSPPFLHSFPSLKSAILLILEKQCVRRELRRQSVRSAKAHNDLPSKHRERSISSVQRVDEELVVKESLSSPDFLSSQDSVTGGARIGNRRAKFD